MKTYFIRRILLILPTFLGLTLLVFAFTRILPGGPVERVMQQMQAMNAEGGGQSSSSIQGGAPLSDDQIFELKKYFGLHEAWPIAYGKWLMKIFQGDLGTSTRYNEPVWSLMKDRFPISLFYGLSSLFLTYLVCIPLGIFKSIYHKSVFDNISSIIVFIGYAIPHYVVGIALIYLFASRFELFPLGGFVSDEFDDFTTMEKIKDLLWHGTLPLISYMAGNFASMSFLMKNTMLEQLSSDYVRTAMSKGLSFKKAVVKHVMRNSLIPIATSFGNNISVILMGSFLIETIFNIDGFGLLGYESLIERDYPVVLGTLVVSSLLFMIGNILSDFCVALVDPRVKFE
jgi:microcin C transport system permease protein